MGTSSSKSSKMSSPQDTHGGGKGYTFPSPSADKSCRACTDFKTWSQQLRKSTSDENKPANVVPESDNHDLATRVAKNCPLDKDQLGVSTWGFLHTMAAYYPEKPTTQQRMDMNQFFLLISRFYPCESCASDFRKELEIEPPETQSTDALSQWLCRIHNTVNVKLGKPVFDCSLVMERWRDGWKDGSCD